MEDYIGSNDTALVGRISFTKRFDQTFVELGPTQTKSLVALSWQFNLFSRVYLFSRFLPKCFLMIFATIFAPKTHCAALTTLRPSSLTLLMPATACDMR